MARLGLWLMISALVMVFAGPLLAASGDAGARPLAALWAENRIGAPCDPSRLPPPGPGS